MAGLGTKPTTKYCSYAVSTGIKYSTPKMVRVNHSHLIAGPSNRAEAELLEQFASFADR
jgi:hypothetical protein